MAAIDSSFKMEDGSGRPPMRSSGEIALIIVKIFFMVILFPVTLIALAAVGYKKLSDWTFNIKPDQIGLPFSEFTLAREDLTLNHGKIRHFDDLFREFTPSYDNLEDTLRGWDIHDFGSRQSLKGDLLNKFLGLEDGSNWERAIDRGEAFEVKRMLLILFNILTIYRNIMVQKSAAASLTTYRENFQEIMERVFNAFHQNCHFNPLSELRVILSEVVGLDEEILSESRSGKSPVDFLFARALEGYQTNLVREKMLEVIQKPLDEAKKGNREPLRQFGFYILQNGFGDREGVKEGSNESVAKEMGIPVWEVISHGYRAIKQPRQFERLEQVAIEMIDWIQKETIELEFVVMKRLGLISHNFEAHLFSGPQSENFVDSIMNAYKEAYDPVEFFLRELTQRYPAEILRKFHTDIAIWYRKQGLDPDDNRALLMNEEGGDYDYWYNEKAILYFMVQNQLLSSI